jgi:O-antigen ligase
VLVGLLFAGTLTAVLGRDTTLTGRTDLWERLLAMSPNAVLGAGFESFWLGDRMTRLWHEYWWKPNQAHNGYLETFLNLGVIGVGLLVAMIVRGYRNVVVALAYDPPTARLKVAYLVAAVLYNLTEAAFKGMHLVWIAFFLAILHVPRLAPAPAAALAAPGEPVELGPVSAPELVR